jgi:uncharacterized membrane protein
MSIATFTSSINRNTFLQRVLAVDACTCIATGALLAMAAEPLASMLGLSASLLLYAGISLVPIAAFIAWVGSRSRVPTAGVWLVIAGNVGWVAGSALVLLMSSPTMLGYIFVVVQAVVVSALAELEFIGLRRNA